MNIREKAKAAVALAKAATPGPWVVGQGYLAGTSKRRVVVEALHAGRSTQEDGYAVASFGPEHDPGTAPDSTFIAAARADVPALAAFALRVTDQKFIKSMVALVLGSRYPDEAAAAISKLMEEK